MKRIISVIALVCAVAAGLGAKERKAVVIIADGIPNDVVERLHMPALEDISSRGSFGRSYVGGTVGSYNQTPTISAVCYNIMLTGTWVNKHNVTGNHNMQPNHNYWSMHRIAKENGRKVAVYSSWTDNREVLLGDVMMDFKADGFDRDTVNFRKQPDDMHIFGYDEATSIAAARSIREDAPDLSWVYLWYTDQAGHMRGNSAFFDEYVTKADIQIGRIWEAVKYREKNFDEQWMVIVLTDHGRTDDGYSHGGQSQRERTTWIASNRKLNRRFRAGEASHADINPTVCEWLGLNVPELVRREQDGISLIGRTEIKNMTLYQYEKKEVIIRWQAVRRNAPVTVYAAKANDYRETGTEQWMKLGTVRARRGEFKVRLEDLGPSDFYKFAVETDHDSLNRWLKN